MSQILFVYSYKRCISLCEIYVSNKMEYINVSFVNQYLNFDAEKDTGSLFVMVSLSHRGSTTSMHSVSETRSVIFDKN